MREQPERVFLFRLALRLGRTVDELVRSISFRELLEWMELYSFDPFDEERADLRNGMLMALLANKDRDKRKRPTPFTFKEFMPYRDKVSQPLPVQAETGQGARVDSNALTYFFIAAGETLPEELE